jgi:hypothetical protein
VGTGSEKFFLDEYILDKLRSYQVRFDVIDSVVFRFKKFQAVSTFNVCNEDRQNVVAFILPGNENEVEFLAAGDVEIDPLNAFAFRK